MHIHPGALYLVIFKWGLGCGIIICWLPALTSKIVYIILKLLLLIVAYNTV